LRHGTHPGIYQSNPPGEGSVSSAAPFGGRDSPGNGDKPKTFQRLSQSRRAAYRLAAKPATILPAWVELSALPSGLEDQIPAVRGYKYVKPQDKVLLVLSESRVVVGEVAR
jgi:hypothetical protein